MSVKDSIKESASKAGEAVGDTYRSARTHAAEAYESAAAKTGELYEGARDKAAAAGRSTARAVDKNPLSALLGGFAVGGLLGALLPRTKKEQELLGPYGRDLTGRAREAADAARAVGREKLDEFGFVRDEAKATGKKLVDKSKEVASEAGSAAAKKARKKD